MSFFIAPTLLTLLVILLMGIFRYRRERDFIAILPYFFRKDTLLAIGGMFLFFIIGHLFLTILNV